MSALAQPRIFIEPRNFMDTLRHECGLGGLIAKSPEREIALPLREVKVRTNIAGNCSRTVIDQCFGNPLSVGMEAVHIFPLPEDGAVVEMELRCGDIIVKAECKERDEAQQDFDEARQQGHRAALLTQERDDVHTLKVTNLPAGEEVTVRLVIVEKLDIVDGEYRWRFPTTIAPRYLPGSDISHEGSGALPDTDRVPDGSRLQAPLRLEGGTKLDLEVQLAAPINNLSSSLHAIRMTMNCGGLKIAPSTRATLNKDFILSFSTGDDQEASLRAWTDGQYTLAVVEPPIKKIADSVPRDAVFVVDISGSMGGAKLEAAKKALVSAVHGLLPGDRFKLIAFDNRIEHFKKSFIDFDSRSLAAADQWIHRLRARGGTDMLPAIKEALAGKTQSGRLRTVLFVTDGQAWNEKELCAAIAYRRKRTRFFTVGIDTAVNGALLKNMARAGGGTCELATPHDDIEEVMSKIEARFGSPVATEIRFTGGIPGRDEELTLFTGRPVTLMLKGQTDFVKVSGLVAGGELNYKVKPARVQFPLGALWARERIQFLEDRLRLNPFEEESIKHHITEAALEHSIASRYTSFVAVEKSSRLTGEKVVAIQSSELPESWDKSQLDTQSLTLSGQTMRTPSPFAGRMRADNKPLRKSVDQPFGAPAQESSRADKKGIISHFKDLFTGKKEEPEQLAGPMGGVASFSAAPMHLADLFGISGSAFGGESDQASQGDPFGLASGGGIPGAPAANSNDPFGSVSGVNNPASGSAFGANSDETSQGDPFGISFSQPIGSADPFGGGLPAQLAGAPMNAPSNLEESVNEEPLDPLEALHILKGPEAGTDFGGELARSQSADGSFGNDIKQTIAAVLALILLGHTRRSGLRRRTVYKAARWLEAQGREGQVDWLLSLLEDADAGEAVKPTEEWSGYAAGDHAIATALRALLPLI
jgi:Ca-activated chloride channel homolog